MTINPNMVNYIRTMVKGDHEENDRIEAHLDADGWEDFSTLLGAVFYFAVNRHLPASASRGAIMRLVAEMRAETPPDGPEVDAHAAEGLIQAALDPSIDINVESEMAGRVQGLTILYLLGNGKATDEELDALFAEAVNLASSI